MSPPLPGDVAWGVGSEPETEQVLSKARDSQGIRQDMHAEPRKGGGLLALLQYFQVRRAIPVTYKGPLVPGLSTEEFGSTRKTDRQCHLGLAGAGPPSLQLCGAPGWVA